MNSTENGSYAPGRNDDRSPGETLAAVRTSLLSPAMTLWTASRELSITHVPRPSDTPQSTVSGVDKLPVLVFGAGPAVGWGVRSHDLALPGSLARALSARTGRGVQVDLVAHRTLTMADVGHLIRDVPLTRYQAIVVVFSIKDALILTSVKRWRAGLTALLDQLDAAVPGTVPIIVTGIQAVRSIPAYDSALGEIASRHAYVLNRVTESVLRDRERFIFEPLVIPAGRRSARHRESGDYVYWARSLATQLAPRVAAATPPDAALATPSKPASAAHPPADDPIDESQRQHAVDLLRLADRGPDERIQKIVDVARRALQADSALFGVLDRDRHIHFAESGTLLGETPRESSFCDLTIRRRDGLTVLDAAEDSRFADNPWVVGGPTVRFYSGFPVEAPNGQRVGALCVFDSQPRTADQVNVELIEELALLIQRELWRYLPES